MSWLDMSLSELTDELKALREPVFRAKQIYAWLHKGANFDEMTNLPKQLRERLKEHLPLGGVTVLEKIISKLDGTTKYLFLLSDGNIVEGVLMHYKYGNTFCISSQVGCRMGCVFCASTIDGLVRNLTPGEMLGQILAIEREWSQEGRDSGRGRAVTNIVMMGSGEPLDNYDNTIKFLHMINDPAGINISLRNISLSTCGLVDKIPVLAKDAPGVTLSISLHAPNDTLRKEMMPIANRYSIAQIIAAAREYVNLTGRRVIFEYALVQGKNDSDACALELSAILHGLQCHINLIPLNTVKERNLHGTALRRAHEFCTLLESLSISATIRREMGDDIQGACGQLRRSYLQDTKTISNPNT